MDGMIYTFIIILIGVALLFFGLKLMKFAVALMGFVLGYALISTWTAGFGWPDPVLIIVSILGGIVFGALAFAFYRIAVTVSIALYFANFTYALMLSFSAGQSEALFVAVLIGIIIFAVALVFKLVDVLFAFSTSAQGAALITASAYSIFTPVEHLILHAENIVAFTQGPYAWAWILGWIVLLVLGLAFQLKSLPRKEATEV